MKSIIRILAAFTWLTVLGGSLQATPQPQVEFTKGAGTTWNIDWDGVSGRTYFVQCSLDLSTWIYAPVVDFGDTPSPYGLDVGGAVKTFVRLQYVDDPSITSLQDAQNADFDNDGLTNLQEVLTHGTKPFALDSSGDGIGDGWAVFYGLDPLADNANGLFQGGPLTNLEAYNMGVQPVPDATPEDLDGDLQPNEFDAEPNQRQIDWERSPVTQYVYIEQPTGKVGAKAVSKYGHILFPGTNNGEDDIEASEILWDSITGSWLNLTEYSTWSNSGLVDPTGENGAFDAPWLDIFDMNDEGIVVGFSNYGATSGSSTIVQAAMKWERTGTATDQYGDPTYLVAPGENADNSDQNSIPDIFLYTTPRIADDGTISVRSWDWAKEPNQYRWVVENVQSGQHSSNMPEWDSFDSDNDFKSGAILDDQTGLFIERDAANSETTLHYGNGGQTYELDGLLVSNSFEVLDTDIGRTPPSVKFPNGRVWFSVHTDAGDFVYIEDFNSSGSQPQFVEIPTMVDGAIRLNSRGEAITENKIWRNGQYTNLSDAFDLPSGITIDNAIDLGSNGIMLIQAINETTQETALGVPSIFLDNKNDSYDLKTEALGISNYVTTNGLPIDGPDSAFDKTCEDPENFRLQATLLDPSAASVPVTLEVVRDGVTISTRVYTLDKKKDSSYRSLFLRLVSDTRDDGASGHGSVNADPDNQTILASLGDTINAKYNITPTKQIEQSISVGLPTDSEDNNEISHKKHDIKELKVNIVVFQNSLGNPVITRAEAEANVSNANARLAQAGIIIKATYDLNGENDIGHPGMEGTFTPSVFPLQNPNAQEQQIVGFADEDNNSIDVFYIEDLNFGAGISYRAGNNNTNDQSYQNFTIIDSFLAGNTNPNTLPHEIMHILLNSSHRDDFPDPEDPYTSLFYKDTDPNQDVQGTKRIGPNSETEPENVAGHDDVTKLRETAENLP